MPKSEPQQLSVYDFGKQLLATRDLDPVYVLLWEAWRERDGADWFHLKTWLLAYFCFYDMGTASYIAEGLHQGVSENFSEYWSRFQAAAASADYPRAHERRHFRGKAAVKATEALYEVGVERWWQSILGKAYYDSNERLLLGPLMTNIQTYPQFGPWIAFKIADMIERLGLARVEFPTSAMSFFDSPQEGAAALWIKEGGKANTRPPNHNNLEEWATERILTTLARRLTSSKNKSWGRPGLSPAKTEKITLVLAPPRYERAINAQEAETILCKWKSYLNGHYTIGEDVEACRKALLRFSRNRLSQRLLAAGRKVELW